MIAVLRQPRSRSALPNEALFLLLLLLSLLLFLLLARVVAPTIVRREERTERQRVGNWKNRGSREEEIGWVCRVETIGRVLFSLSNLCTIFRYRKLKRFGRKCDALVGENFPFFSPRSSAKESEVSLCIVLERNRTLFSRKKGRGGGKIGNKMWRNCKITEYVGS